MATTKGRKLVNRDQWTPEDRSREFSVLMVTANIPDSEQWLITDILIENGLDTEDIIAQSKDGTITQHYGIGPVRAAKIATAVEEYQKSQAEMAERNFLWHHNVIAGRNLLGEHFKTGDFYYDLMRKIDFSFCWDIFQQLPQRDQQILSLLWDFEHEGYQTIDAPEIATQLQLDLAYVEKRIAKATKLLFDSWWHEIVPYELKRACGITDTRAINSLRAQSIILQSEVIALTKKDLLRIPGIGPKTADHIIQSLASQGLSLAN